MAVGGEDLLSDEYISLVHTSDAVYDFYCEICQLQEKSIKADGYCQLCEIYMCNQCIKKQHEASKYSHLQETIAVENASKENLLASFKISSTKCNFTECSNHGKRVEYFCWSHDQLVCSECLENDHKTCDQIDWLLQELARQPEILKTYKQLEKGVGRIRQMSQAIVKSSKDNNAAAKKYKIEVKKTLEDIKKKVMARFEEFEAAIDTKASSLETDSVDKMKHVIEKAEKVDKCCQVMMSRLQQLKESNYMCELLVVLNEGKRCIKTLNAQLTKIQQENEVREFRLEFNHDLDHIFDTLGKIVEDDISSTAQKPVKAIESCRESQRSKGTKTCTPKSDSAGTEKLKTEKISVKPERDRSSIDQEVTTKPVGIELALLVAEIDVRSKHDRSVMNTMTGSVVLPENRLIIVCQNNHKIKLIDMENKMLTNETKLDLFPWDATMVSRNQIAVTAVSDKFSTKETTGRIYLLGVTASLVVEKEIPLAGNCRGIAYFNGNLLVTFAVYDPRLDILNLDGELIKSIRTDITGLSLFKSPNYVCVQGDRIYISDYFTGKVICMTQEREVIQTYSDTGLRNPQKVCVDHKGHVYVVGYESVNVHMLTSDCRKIRTILSKETGLWDTGGDGLYTVSFCEDTNSLCVAVPHRNTIKVFEIIG